MSRIPKTPPWYPPDTSGHCRIHLIWGGRAFFPLKDRYWKELRRYIFILKRLSHNCSQCWTPFGWPSCWEHPGNPWKPSWYFRLSCPGRWTGWSHTQQRRDSYPFSSGGKHHLTMGRRGMSFLRALIHNASPIICGYNSGQHMFVPASNQCNTIQINIDTGSTTTTRWMGAMMF